MFEYELPEGKPNGRLRTLPEIPATPYSRHMPARTISISRTEYLAEWAKYALENRLSASEAMMWVWLHSPYIVVAGSIAVGTLDSALGLGIAQEMAEVKVDEEGGAFEQLGQQIIHDIGVAAGGDEK